MSPGGPLMSAAPKPHHAANSTPNKMLHGGPQRPGAMQQQQQMPPSPNYYGQPRPHPGIQPMIDASQAPMPRGLAPGWGNQQQPQPTPQQQQQMQMRKSLGGGTVQVPNTKAQLQQHMPQAQALNMTPNISGKHMRMSLPG